LKPGVHVVTIGIVKSLKFNLVKYFAFVATETETADTSGRVSFG